MSAIFTRNVKGAPLPTVRVCSYTQHLRTERTREAHTRHSVTRREHLNTNRSPFLTTRTRVRCNLEVNSAVRVIPHAVTSVCIQSQFGKSNCCSVLCDGPLPLMQGDMLLGSDYNFIIHTRAFNDLLWRLRVFFVVLIFLLLCCGVESLLEGRRYRPISLAS
jgi:hypothetical protein